MSGFTEDWMRNESPHYHQTRQVCMTDVVWDWFVAYVYGRGLSLFPIPDADGGFEYPDDIPTYGVGPGGRP